MDADVRVETNGLFENCAIIESNASIPFLLGRDNHGQFFVKDLAVMPHAIICGVSGAGKTSFLQTVLTAIAYNRPAKKLSFWFSPLSYQTTECLKKVLT